MVNRLYNKQVSPKGYKTGGHVNTPRMNRLEELGRVDELKTEKGSTKRGKANLGDEKRRIVRELRRRG